MISQRHWQRRRMNLTHPAVLLAMSLLCAAGIAGVAIAVELGWLQ